MNRTITKADIVDHLHHELGLSKSECKQLVEDFFQEIKDSLINDEEVKLSEEMKKKSEEFLEQGSEIYKEV